jgi:PAS domain S-box-containing protein
MRGLSMSSTSRTICLYSGGADEVGAAVFDFLTHLFDTTGFPPRWNCGDWTPGHGWLHILSDLAVWSAYFAIPCILVYFVLRRRDVPFPAIFWLFGAFILACGTTHLMEAIIFWHPVYRLAGVIKLLTAVVSWGTVVALVPTLPKALAMRTPDELEREIAARKRVEDALQRAKAELEMRVQERTAELAELNSSLRESQQREKERADELEAILRATPTPIWIAHDPQCHRITGNPASFTLLGLPERSNVSAAASPGHDPAKRGYREYRNGKPIPVDELPMQRAARGEPVNGAEVQFVFDDGRVRHIFGNAVPLRNSDGSVRGVIAAFADVTPLKEADASLRRNQQILKLVHQIGKIGHWEWDSLTDENRWSPEIEALYGLPPGGFEGGYQGWAKLLHPDDLPRAEADVRRALQTGKYFTEFRVIWPDGSVHWLEARANVFKDGHDKPVRIMGVNMDVTERKRVEEELRKSQQELRQRIEQLAEADRRKDEFLATLAHELRNPLAPLRNAVELLRRSGANPGLIEQARGVMGRQLDQMVRIVDDLLDVSRISQGKVQLRKERVELEVVVRSAVEGARPFIDAQGHQLTITLPPEAVWFDGDPTRLAQVISNLLNNAAKYTEKGGHIWLTAERRGSEAVLSVRDTGIGIAAEHLPQLFEMFSQIIPALERSQGGLGIGLSLVRGLVELHGGRVQARSDGIGRGSEFIVRLPVVDVPIRQQPEGPADDGLPPGTRKWRILVVDDNRDAADSLAMMLQMMGHETCTAYDGLETVQAAATFRPQVVLLDIGLPKMNGYEVARHIRQQPWGEGLALIALTGWGQEEDKRRALDAGFDHHLTKPVGATALEKLLGLINPVPQQ